MKNNGKNILIVVFSYHHKNTEKVAKVFAEVLNAQIKEPREINPEELINYDLVGFGSGIYSAKHHKFLLNLADELPRVSEKKAFIFSTDGAPRGLMKHDPSAKEKLLENHSLLRDKLQSKGYEIVDEFNCGGLNTNSFLKLFGGINKGRPNIEDLKNAEKFAQKLLKVL